jgi:hypothetical protein
MPLESGSAGALLELAESDTGDGDPPLITRQFDWVENAETKTGMKSSVVVIGNPMRQDSVGSRSSLIFRHATDHDVFSAHPGTTRLVSLQLLHRRHTIGGITEVRSRLREDVPGRLWSAKFVLQPERSQEGNE